MAIAGPESPDFQCSGLTKTWIVTVARNAGKALRMEKAINRRSKVMTNADKIRNMSDEDLADFLSDMTNQCESNTSCNQHCYGCYEEYCDSEKCLKWLQSEVIA